MTTLVYFASGPYKEEYQDLKFDTVYIVDRCFKRVNRQIVFKIRKVVCLGMDCLDAIDYLKVRKVKIDCFVSINEGLYEGGGRYPINSDMFVGYVAPLLSDKYVHIMNPSYYSFPVRISMDFPYVKELILQGDELYINAEIFSNTKPEKVMVYQMTKIHNDIETQINSMVKLRIIHDSIWNHYNELDCVVLSIGYCGKGDFFKKYHKVIDINESSLKDILFECVKCNIKRIGFTPWGRGDYRELIEFINNYNEKWSLDIILFYLNYGDYKMLKDHYFDMN